MPGAVGGMGDRDDAGAVMGERGAVTIHPGMASGGTERHFHGGVVGRAVRLAMHLKTFLFKEQHQRIYTRHKNLSRVLWASYQQA